LLAGAGAAGAGLVAASAGVMPGLTGSAQAAAQRGLDGAQALAQQPPGAPANAGLFGRLFPQLPPFASVNSQVIAALMEVGRQGGIMDAGDNLATGPKALITDPAVNGNPTSGNSYGTNPDNPAMTAGSTFVGQFTDHDITFDQTSQLGVSQNPLTSPNARTPASHAAQHRQTERTPHTPRQRPLRSIRASRPVIHCRTKRSRPWDGPGWFGPQH
jgi:hypothetical protein